MMTERNIGLMTEKNEGTQTKPMVSLEAAKAQVDAAIMLMKSGVPDYAVKDMTYKNLEEIHRQGL
jgi:hypothetical protein